MGRAVTGPQWLAGLEAVQRWSHDVAAWFAGGYDILVTPVSPEPPTVLGDLTVEGQGDPFTLVMRFAGLMTFTFPWNITGQPAISLPLHWSDTGLPIGVQLIAPTGREDLLFRLAAQLETAAPWAGRRPPVLRVSAGCADDERSLMMAPVSRRPAFRAPRSCSWSRWWWARRAVRRSARPGRPIPRPRQPRGPTDPSRRARASRWTESSRRAPRSTTGSTCSRSVPRRRRTCSCSSRGRRPAPRTSGSTPRPSCSGSRDGRSGRSTAARTSSRTTPCSTRSSPGSARRSRPSTTTSAGCRTRDQPALRGGADTRGRLRPAMGHGRRRRRSARRRRGREEARWQGRARRALARRRRSPPRTRRGTSAAARARDDLDGLVLIDGASGPGSPISVADAQAQLAKLATPARRSSISSGSGCRGRRACSTRSVRRPWCATRTPRASRTHGRCSRRPQAAGAADQRGGSTATRSTRRPRPKSLALVQMHIGPARREWRAARLEERRHHPGRTRRGRCSPGSRAWTEAPGTTRRSSRSTPAR